MAVPRALWRRLCHVWALIRARRLSQGRLRRRRPQRLLVLCYGNIYRSPYVAARLRAQLASAAGRYAIQSAGFHQVIGRPSPAEFVERSRDYGAELAGHRSRLVDPADIDWAETIVIMDRYNWERVARFGPAALDKVVWLGAFSDRGPIEIRDPYGLPPAAVRTVLDQMQKAADGLAQRLRSIEAGARRDRLSPG